jgi:hypothetical protein
LLPCIHCHSLWEFSSLSPYPRKPSFQTTTTPWTFHNYRWAVISSVWRRPISAARIPRVDN